MFFVVQVVLVLTLQTTLNPFSGTHFVNEKIRRHIKLGNIFL